MKYNFLNFNIILEKKNKKYLQIHKFNEKYNAVKIITKRLEIILYYKYLL